MDEKAQSPKPADSDVASLTLEQMRVNWERMMQNTHNSFPNNTSVENIPISLPPFGLTPTMMMQLAMMQMPLMSMQEGLGIAKDHTKADVKNNKSNNTAHSLLDNYKQESFPSGSPRGNKVSKRYRKQTDYVEKPLESRHNVAKTAFGINDNDDLLLEDLEGMDEKDLKRLKRKQSNRESARRSRMRKQAECEGLMIENADLRSEILQLRTQEKELREVIASLKGRIDDLTR